jgi:hypothetical protein
MNYGHTLHIGADARHAWDRIDFYLHTWEPNRDMVGCFTPLEAFLKPRHEVEGTMHRDPIFTLSHLRCQELLNSLWDQGVRPAQAKGGSEEMARALAHLADMRTIAFAKLKVAAPQSEKGHGWA